MGSLASIAGGTNATSITSLDPYGTKPERGDHAKSEEDETKFNKDVSSVGIASGCKGRVPPVVFWSCGAAISLGGSMVGRCESEVMMADIEVRPGVCWYW